MEQNQNNNEGNQPLDEKQPKLTQELMAVWMQQQSKKLEIEQGNLKLGELRIQSNERVACRAMDYQARDMKAAPGEFRKNIVTFATIFLVFGGCFIGVVLYLLSINKDEFAYNLLKGATYFVLSLFSFYAGRKSKPSPKREKDFTEVQEAETVD